MMCRGHGIPEMVTPAMRTTAVSLGFLNLTKYAMFSFAMTSGLASDSDKFKINITLRRALKFRDTGWYDDVPGARSTRDGDTGNEDNSSFARFFKLDKICHVPFCHDKRLGK